MKLRQIFESKGSVGIMFGRFNPPHKGHKAAWEMASENKHWYIGTNESTVGPKDPLPYDVKVEAMKAIWPEVATHIVSETSWLTLASKVYEKFGNVTLNVYTDEEWVIKTLMQYNGSKNTHGHYHFTNINPIPTPRLSSATALRAAVAAGDRGAFAQAAGVDADTQVAGHSFFDLVSHYLAPYAAKAAAKKPAAKKKKAVEPEQELGESTSLPTTLKAIINDIGEPVGMVYDTMKFMAKKYYDNHGEINRGFNMVAAGVGGRWIQKFYVNKLHNELYDLCKYNTRRTVELQEFLRGREINGKIELERSFKNISQELPMILAKIGQHLDSPQLVKNAQRWMQRREEYEAYLDSLDDSGYDEPAIKHKAPKDPTVGQQHSQVDQIVSHILSKVPSKVAGEIRNAIARNPNKLQALQAELKKRNINVDMEEGIADQIVAMGSSARDTVDKALGSIPKPFDEKEVANDIKRGQAVQPVSQTPNAVRWDKVNTKGKPVPEEQESKLYKYHQKLRKERGLPDPDYYKKLGQQKQKEIDDLKKDNK